MQCEPSVRARTHSFHFHFLFSLFSSSPICLEFGDFRFSFGTINRTTITSTARHIINFYKTVHLTGIYKQKLPRPLVLALASDRNAAINCHLRRKQWQRLNAFTFWHRRTHTHSAHSSLMPNCPAKKPNWFIENIFVDRVARRPMHSGWLLFASAQTYTNYIKWFFARRARFRARCSLPADLCWTSSMHGTELKWKCRCDLESNDWYNVRMQPRNGTNETNVNKINWMPANGAATHGMNMVSNSEFWSISVKWMREEEYTSNTLQVGKLATSHRSHNRARRRRSKGNDECRRSGDVEMPGPIQS